LWLRLKAALILILIIFIFVLIIPQSAEGTGRFCARTNAVPKLSHGEAIVGNRIVDAIGIDDNGVVNADLLCVRIEAEPVRSFTNF
jgi:hypothetical protein